MKWLLLFLQELAEGLFARPDHTEPIREHPMNLPPEAPKPPVVVPPVVVKPTLLQFCTLLRNYEGKPGDLNYRNNNPGNFRCSSVGYAAKYGNVKCVNNFSVFPSYEQGWQYLLAIVRERGIKHPTWTIRDFFLNYAPFGDDNDPELYGKTIAKGLKVDVSYLIKNLT